MASLNTLRTRFGVILSIIIAFALLAFILSLKADMGFSGNDPKVGTIDGSKIKYSEYIEVYDNIKAQTNASEGDQAQMDQLADLAWQNLIASRVYLPGFEKMGIVVTESERQGLINGDYYSQMLATYFTDPATGRYDVAAVSDFLTQAVGNPQLQGMWAGVMDQAMKERQGNKYNGLVNAGVYVNALEAAEGAAAANKTFGGRWTGKRYYDLSDSLFTVSDAEIRAYYDSHKARYAQKPSRTISYVVFEVAPSAEDMATLEQTVRAVGEEFAAADDVKAFVRSNRYGRIANNFVSPRQISDEQAEALGAGMQYGPVLKNDNWIMSRVVETLNAPDSVGLRHIVLTYDQRDLADSLTTALRQGGDFAAAAREYSLATQDAANGGDAGVMPFSAFPDEFTAQLANARVGDILQVELGQIIQLLQVYRLDKPSKHLRIATITYPVEASSATRRAVHAQASSFSVEGGKGSIDAFNAAADNAALTPRVAKLTQGERTLRGLDDSRALVRWAYETKTGRISEIFPVGNDYVVAMVTEIDDNDYTPLKKVSDDIRKIVLNDKKYDRIVGQMQGATLEEVAAALDSEIVEFKNVRAGSYYIPDMGIEPRAIGAIASTEELHNLSEPVKGNVGTYVFEVTDVAEAETPQTVEAEKVRAEAAAQTQVQRRLFDAMEEMAEVEDLRARYI